MAMRPRCRESPRRVGRPNTARLTEWRPLPPPRCCPGTRRNRHKLRPATPNRDRPAIHFTTLLRPRPLRCRTPAPSRSSIAAASRPTLRSSRMVKCDLICSQSPTALTALCRQQATISTERHSARRLRLHDVPSPINHVGIVSFSVCRLAKIADLSSLVSQTQHQWCPQEIQ